MNVIVTMITTKLLYGFHYERGPLDVHPPPPPPPSAQVLAGPGGCGYAKYEHYYNDGYARERTYSHTAYSHPPPQTPPSPPQLAAGPISPPRIWVPAQRSALIDHPPPKSAARVGAWTSRS